MKKAIFILLTLTTLSLMGCKSKSYGNCADYESQETEEYHVSFAKGDDHCYSDGQFWSNVVYNRWLEEYKEKH